MTKRSVYAVVANLAALALIVFLFTQRGAQPDSTTYEGLSAKRVFCAEPQYVNDSGCASKRCFETLHQLAKLAPNYQQHPSVASMSQIPGGWKVEGKVEAIEGEAAFPTKTYNCIVESGKVVALKVDGRPLLEAER